MAIETSLASKNINTSGAKSATGTTTSNPLISQSVLRQLRSGAFRTKRPVGPETTQAIVEGSLEKDVELAKAEASRQQQIKLEQDRLAQQREIALLQIQEQRRARKAQEKSFADSLLGS